MRKSYQAGSIPASITNPSERYSKWAFSSAEQRFGPGLLISKNRLNTKYMEKKKQRPRKRKPMPALVKKLDTIFSLFIRLRDSDSGGYCRCISCGSVHFWKDMHNGHFVNRGHMSTRFDEKNCNAQCMKCNMFDEGNNIGYIKGLIRKYGIRVIEELELKKHSLCSLSTFEYEILIKHYSDEVKKLRAEKNL